MKLDKVLHLQVSRELMDALVAEAKRLFLRPADVVRIALGVWIGGGGSSCEQVPGDDLTYRESSRLGLVLDLRVPQALFDALEDTAHRSGLRTSSVAREALFAWLRRDGGRHEQG